MKNLQELFSSLSTFPEDLRAEVVIAGLLECGLSPEEILIKPQGIFKRRYSTDIDSFELLEGASRDSAVLQITLNRDGLLHALPEGVLHQPNSRKLQKDIRQVVEQIRLQRHREIEAGKFLLPFEQEFYWQRVWLEQIERTYCLEIEQVKDTDSLSEFWELPAFLNERQRRNMLFLLPMAHQIVGNLSLTEQCLENILGDKVTIAVAPPVWHKIKDMQLSTGRLGADTVLGEFARDVLPAFEISVFLSHYEQISDYLPGETKAGLLQWLLTYFIPFEQEVTITIELPREQQTFLISEEVYSSRLGYSTYLTMSA